MFWAMAGYDWLPVASLQGPIPSNLPVCAPHGPF